VKENRDTNVPITAEYPQFGDPVILAQVVRELEKNPLEQVVQEMKRSGSGILQQAVAELTSAPDPDSFVLSQAILEHVVPELTKPRIAGPISAKLSQFVRELLAPVP
jgi:hypothetical protein